MEILRHYGRPTSIDFPAPKYLDTSFNSDPFVWATGNVRIIKDGGTPANTVNLPAHKERGMFRLDLTANEISASSIALSFIDSAATGYKAVMDNAIVIATFGSTSGMYAFDFDTWPTQAATVSQYIADIQVDLDSVNAKDEYTVSWFADAVPITGSITNPTIQIIKRSDGTNLIPATGLTEFGAVAAYKYDESLSANRINRGESYLIVANATIGGSTRSFRRTLGRDI